jgi:hypothetical protein
MVAPENTMNMTNDFSGNARVHYPTYSGTREEDATDFILDFKRVARLNDLPPTKWVLTATCYLRGFAKTWINKQEKSGKSFETIEEFGEALLQYFGAPQSLKSVTTRLSALSTRSMTIHEYNLEFSRIADKCDELSERQKVTLYLKGLPPKVHDWILGQRKHRKLEESMEAAVEDFDAWEVLQEVRPPKQDPIYPAFPADGSSRPPNAHRQEYLPAAASHQTPRPPYQPPRRPAPRPAHYPETGPGQRPRIVPLTTEERARCVQEGRCFRCREQGHCAAECNAFADTTSGDLNSQGARA